MSAQRLNQNFRLKGFTSSLVDISFIMKALNRFDVRYYPIGDNKNLITNYRLAITVNGIERTIRPTNHKSRLKERFGERRFCDSHPESLLVTSKRHVLGRELMHMIASPSQIIHNSCCAIPGSRFNPFGHYQPILVVGDINIYLIDLSYPTLPPLMLLMLIFSSDLGDINETSCVLNQRFISRDSKARINSCN